LNIDGYAPVHVLFDETFVTNDSSSVHVLCIDAVIDSDLSTKPSSSITTVSSESRSADVDSISTTLFGMEADMRFEANVQASCCQMRRRLLAEHDFCHRSIDHIKVKLDYFVLIDIDVESCRSAKYGHIARSHATTSTQSETWTN